jgi:hypothetical protein
MKTLLALFSLMVLSSCGLQPDPSWAPSPKPSVEQRDIKDVIHPNNDRP